MSFGCFVVCVVLGCENVALDVYDCLLLFRNISPVWVWYLVLVATFCDLLFTFGL